MKENKITPEEQVIKKMLGHAFHQEGFDLQIEASIMHQVQLSQEKLTEIAALKRKAKICLGITFGFLLLFGLLSTNMFLSGGNDMEQSPASIITFSSCMVVMFFFIFYQLTYLGTKSERVLRK